jgi:hypothetical protein
VKVVTDPVAKAWREAVDAAWNTGDLKPLAKMFCLHEPRAQERKLLAALCYLGEYQKHKPPSRRETHIERLVDKVHRLESGDLTVPGEQDPKIARIVYRLFGIKGRDSRGCMSRDDAITVVAAQHDEDRRTIENAVLRKRGSARRRKKKHA